MIDPPRWEGLTHPEIYDLVVTRAPQFPTSVSAAAADLWAEGQALIPRIDERIARAMQRSAEGWAGTAADSARSAMTPLSVWALDSTGDAKLTLGGVELQADQAKIVRDTMPEPDMTVWSGSGVPPLSTPARS